MLYGSCHQVNGIEEPCNLIDSLCGLECSVNKTYVMACQVLSFVHNSAEYIIRFWLHRSPAQLASQLSTSIPWALRSTTEALDLFQAATATRSYKSYIETS